MQKVGMKLRKNNLSMRIKIETVPIHSQWKNMFKGTRVMSLSTIPKMEKSHGLSIKAVYVV
jgi:hypothetical protein